MGGRTFGRYIPDSTTLPATPPTNLAAGSLRPPAHRLYRFIIFLPYTTTRTCLRITRRAVMTGRVHHTTGGLRWDRLNVLHLDVLWWTF